MNWILPIILLVASNVFMTFAWYGHLKLQRLKIGIDATPLFVVVLLSWLIALAEHSFQRRGAALEPLGVVPVPDSSGVVRIPALT